MGLNFHQATTRRQFTLYHLVPRNFWNSSDHSKNDERLSRPFDHLVEQPSDFKHRTPGLGIQCLNYLAIEMMPSSEVR